MSWTAEELDHLRRAHELEIATPGRDGVLRPFVPIWLVVADDRLYVRTWYRRDTGWYGRALRSGDARIRVPGVEADVDVTELGTDDPALREQVDAAYLMAYGNHGTGSVAAMVADEAAATTLRLNPPRPRRLIDLHSRTM